MKTKNILFFAIIFFMAACTNIAKGLLMPNQCKKCEVYNINSGEVLFNFEGCGATNVRLEEQAKVYAFDAMRNGNCNVDVRCSSWTQEASNNN